MINKFNQKTEEFLLTSVCYKSIINQIILHCLDTNSHVHYHVPFPTKFRRLLIDIVKSAITCNIIQNEHHIEIMCDVLLKEPILSYTKIDAILTILNDVFDKIDRSVKTRKSI